MFQTWVDWIVAVLLIAAVALWLTHFFGDKNLNARIQSRLTDLWLHLDEVRLANVGHAEAVFTLSVMQRVFGSGMFTWKRWVSSVLFTLFATVLLACLLGVAGRYEVLASFRAELPRYAVLVFPYLVVTNLFSISLTYLAVAYSLRRLKSRTLSTLYFVLVLAGTVYISLVLFYLMVLVHELMEVAAQDDFIDVVFLASYIPHNLRGIISLELADVFWPFTGLPAMFGEPGQFDRPSIYPIMFYLNQSLLVLIRVVLALLFVALLLSRFAFQFLRLTILRFVDSDKAALNILAGGLAGLAGIIKLFKG